MKNRKATYIRTHPRECNCKNCANGRSHVCDLVELGTDHTIKTFKSPTTRMAAEIAADLFALRNGYLVVDYNPSTKVVTGTIDVTLKDMLRNSEKTFPLYLAIRLVGKLRNRLQRIRYSTSDPGDKPNTVGIHVEAKFK